MAKWILAAVFAVVGLPFILIAMRVFARDRVIAGWPTVQGVIASSQMASDQQQYKDDHGYWQYRTVYRPVVSFTYTVDGIEMTGTRIARSIPDAMDRKPAQRYLDRFPAGTQVAVHYDKADPRTAYLEVGRRSTGAVILLVFGCVLLAIAALFLALAVFT
jgi:hypothetical protein